MSIPDMALDESWNETRPAPSAEWRRRRKAFVAARRHSRWVRRLRIGLPLAGLVTVIAFSITTHFAMPENLDLSVAQLSVTRNSIIMDNPELNGFDADHRRYSVSADRAVQALTDPDKVDLEVIKAVVTVTGQGTTTVEAESGSYDNGEGSLLLHGAIAVSSSEGYGLRMTNAAIDFKAGTMTSANPVTISYQDSETIGDSIAVGEGGQIIVLQGAVRTTLMPPKQAARTAATQPVQQGMTP